MNISVVGTGYVGLVSGTCLAEMGNNVTCVDNNVDKVAQMQAGIVPIYEPGLEAIFRRNIREGRLHFTTDLRQGVLGATAIFLALPTPPEEDGSADLRHIMEVADQLGPLLTGYTVIIDKSTVPIGTSDKVKERIAAAAKAKFDVVSNPEFLREGFAVEDFMKPDRVVVGAETPEAFEVMREIYAPLTDQYRSLMEMDPRSAEAAKYAANTFLALKISYMNQVAAFCEASNANVDDVRRAIGADDRIGKRFLFPGTGYGGSCFPKDVKAMLHMMDASGVPTEIVEAIETVNNRQKKILPKKMRVFYGGDLSGKTFGLWGLAFKPDTDDIREAPALDIINELTAEGATVVAYDPEAIESAKRHFNGHKGLSYAADMYAALEGADALVVATDWREFKSPDYDRMKKTMATPVIFDGRNHLSLKAMKRHGFHYESIGRAVVN